jgi:hypothetical protein
MAIDPQEFLEGAGKALKTVPELYSDGLKPTVRESGKFLARIPRAINAALSPIDIWIAKKEYNVEQTKILLARKLINVDPSKIVPPEPYVAVPAIQAISYSMDSEVLRNMYANLLARSMHTDEKINVHPAFVEIIKQMSPLDAQVLKFHVETTIKPMISICGNIVPASGRYIIIRHITWLAIASIKQVSIALDNLQKCGMIFLKDNEAYTKKSNYDCIKQSPLYISARNSCMDKPNENIVDQEGIIEVTDFGNSFYDVCIKDI